MMLTTYIIVMPGDEMLFGCNTSTPEKAIAWFMSNVSAPDKDWTFHEKRGVRVLPFSCETKKEKRNG